MKISSAMISNSCDVVESLNNKRSFSFCVGCGEQILDQYILQVAPDLEWHATCLKCQECRQFLDESSTCFVKDGKTYCKLDYVRLFGTKCDKCGFSFSKNDFVMRAKSKVFHLECFKCTACFRLLIPGDEFALREDGLFCKMDNDALLQLTKINPDTSFIKIENDESQSGLRNIDTNDLGSNSDDYVCLSIETESESGGLYKNVKVRNRSSLDGKTRIRTVLTEKQLHTLSTFFNVNPRPDALMKEQLVEMTGLSPRVIRVWFQNKRCKHNKKTNQLKLQMEREKEMKQIFYGRMNGEKMVASSPVRNGIDESHNFVHNITYQPPWSTISDLSFSSETESC